MTQPEQTRMGHHSICFIFPSLGLGGAERQIERYLTKLPDDFFCTVVYFDDMFDGTHQSMSPRFKALGADTIFFHLKKANPLNVLGLSSLLRKLKPEIVHTVLAGSSGTWGRLAAFLAGIPRIVHSDLSLNPPVTKAHRLLRPYLDRVTDLFLPNAEAIACWLRGMEVPEAKIAVMSNGIDLTTFCPGDGQPGRRRYGIPENALVAGFLGKFRPEKRVDLLLEALVRLPGDKRPDYVLLGGDGPEYGTLASIISRDSWLAAHCKLIDLVDDVPMFLRCIDYLILCSEREGLPNAVLEAMAVGRPIVATRVSDVPRMIEGVGFLAEPCDAAGLAEAIAAMQSLSQSERQAMGLSARQRAVSSWGIEEMAMRFWQKHREVLR